MSTNLLNLADCLTATCVRVIAEWTDIRIPHDTMALIIARSRVEDTLLEYYSAAAESLDTDEREWLMDLVGEHYTGKTHWPMFCDSAEYKKDFYHELYRNAKAQGAEILNVEGVTR